MSTCDCQCDVPRDGSSQRGRYLKALDPSYAPIDGRRLEDLLVFASRYAAHVRFYDVPESRLADDAAASGAMPSWRDFFRRDLAVIAASIATVDVAKIKRDYDQLRASVERRASRAALHALFDPILGMVRQIDRWHGVAIEGNPLRSDLELAISSTLREQVGRMRAYEEGFKYEDPANPLQLDYSTIDRQAWGLDAPVTADKSAYHGAEATDRIRNAALYVDDVFNAFHGFMTELVTTRSLGYLNFALEAYPAHQPHMALFIAFLELFQVLQEQMNGLTARMLDFYYRDVLRLTPKPAIADRVHVVFELAKDVTEYDVAAGTALKGGKDASGKDLTYETATDLVVNQARVSELKNILIAASAPEAEGQLPAIDVFASPVANSLDGRGAKITDPSGKWWTFGRGSDRPGDPQSLCYRLSTLGEDVDGPREPARIGFALASPQLMLQGGNRFLMWRLSGIEDLADFLEVYLTGAKGWLKVDRGDPAILGKLFEGNAMERFNPAASVAGPFHVARSGALFIYLPMSADPVVGYDPALHDGPAYATVHPMVRVMVRASALPRDRLRMLRSGEQTLVVRVGSFDPEDTPQEKRSLYFDGLKTMVVETASGVVDSSKPFDPFTLFPHGGMSFFVGSPEVFNKPFVPRLELGRLGINVRRTDDEDDEIASKSDPRLYAVYVLRDRQWRRVSTPSGASTFNRFDLSSNVLQTSVVEQLSPFELPRLPLESFSELRSDLAKGFVRLDLALRERVADIQSSQNLAPRLQIKEISLSYTSVLDAPDPEVEQFFHVYPFGVTEVFLGSLIAAEPDDPMHQLFAKLDSAKGGLLVDAHLFLLPQFTYLGPNAIYRAALEATKVTVPSGPTPATPVAVEPAAPSPAAPAPPSPCEAFIDKLLKEAKPAEGNHTQYSGIDQEQGMLLIGLEGLRPFDTLSLLFEFAEGSAADEDDDPPEIHWSYLTGNEWRPLKGEHLVSDGTYGFQTTGIVKIDVPEDSTDNNSIFTPGLRWFCASVSEHADRIPMLISVVAQAVEAELHDNDNDATHFDNAFPAGSISKLVVPVNEIAKISQPFASFDGKHREIGREFHTRASERLRHKARAITAWDYEHLVLDRFPTIYKVKCITHTDPNCLCRGPVKKPDAAMQTPEPCCGPQVAPGHVLVVPIANLKSRNTVNPLQPKTSRRTLLAIQDYLGPRTSPFVHVHARNPVYEQILVFFQVQFTPGTNKGFFLKKLNDEIVHYLTPWAFDEDAEVSFGQKMFASAIINFIEERPYVDFIVDFLMFVCRDACCPKTPEQSEAAHDAIARIANCCDAERIFASKGHDFICDVIAEPSTARSILVSAPRHIIIPYEPTLQPSPCEARRAKKTSTPVGPPAAPPDGEPIAVPQSVDMPHAADVAAPTQPSSGRRRSAASKTRTKPKAKRDRESGGSEPPASERNPDE